MDISILFSLKQPIYEQIVTQIVAQILNGELREEDQLPSIRKLASELKVSVITTKRAYEELERAGYVHTVTGKGTFIAYQDKENVKLNQIEVIKNELRRIVPDCKKYNIQLTELQKIMQLIYEEG
ncbi:GntR family transcriptional regulator [Paenibacillus albidus]|uniref:GntR family transcriptional regulator n=1 Tax=Paenibacillus albidus TaxID=2041023 RepID=A0A917C0C1_9BACL|nr:GntR family transcriptional regulator [Paenibacillus albidus]GGF65859.1 GntR family transcriptional regulator [Paenibacillus albidus]